MKFLKHLYVQVLIGLVVGITVGHYWPEFGAALKQSRFVLEGLEVDAQAMRRNIDLTHGLVMSEAVMMGLGPYIGREYAHDLVYDICREALKQQRPLLDLLAEHPEIKRHLDRAALAKLCDPANYLGQSGVMVDRVLATLR